MYRWIVLFALLFSGCVVEPIAPKTIAISKKTISFTHDVKPILDKRCVVCHSCYNSPCQLKLSSYDGLMRGASKDAIYDAKRTKAILPTRLFIDATSVKEWQERGFFSVVEDSFEDNQSDATLLKMLYTKNGDYAKKYSPENDKLTCAKKSEVDRYLRKNPHRAMPYGFPAISQAEFNTIASWLKQGAIDDTNRSVSLSAQKQIEAIEALLNNPDAKHAMSARYLYEHLFLAELYFDESGEFFRLVRSLTPAPQRVQEVKTRRPYEDAGKFYYRFVKINATVVHKTHITLKIDSAFITRYKELFLQTPWLQTPHTMPYEKRLASNPFYTYEQIPPRVRYEFLLSISEFLTRTFIRGPVCKGQIALNVIEDKFWVFFMDPNFDVSVQDPNFLSTQIENLKMPIERGSNFELVRTFTDRYTQASERYVKARQKAYEKRYPKGLGYEAIWLGNRPQDAPAQTVLRHFDSATILKGLHGNLPKSMWVLDFPLYERIYYNLVAGFDVFGNLAHQYGVRKYFNGSRMEGEANFLAFMPKASRHDYFAQWYQGMNSEMSAKKRLSDAPSAIAFKTKEYKREFAEELVKRFDKALKIGFDKNYIKVYPEMPTTFHSKEDYVNGFLSLTKAGSNFTKNITSYYANVIFIRIKRPDNQDIYLTMVINRWHDNVAFMFNEKSRLNPKKDTVDFYEGLISSYPNALFVVEEEALRDFLLKMEHYDGSASAKEGMLDYFVARDEANFWEEFDAFQTWFLEHQPIEAGLFDLNRYNPYTYTTKQ